MSLNRISFLEGWERNPAAFLRGRVEETGSAASDEESDVDQDLPESLSSSFPSTYSRLNFNPYAGPAWSERGDDRDDRSLTGISPTRTREAPAERGWAPGPVAVPEPKAKSRDWLSETTGAFEISPARRIVQVCLAIVYCFVSAGIVFGFAALKPVLVSENVYRNYCSLEELAQNVPVCDGQEIRLNLMFTIAAVATNVSALPVGTILDSWGPRVSGIIGGFLLAFGAIIFAFADLLPFDGYISGYLLLSLGGPFIFISSFQLSNTFPLRSGLILSALTGAFDASSAVFLIFRLINERSGGSFSVRKFFLLYLTVPALIVVAQLILMPITSYKTTGELVQHAETQITEERRDQTDTAMENRHESERQRQDRRAHRQSIVHQIQDLLDDGTDSIFSATGADDTLFSGLSSPRRPISPRSTRSRPDTPKPLPMPPNAPNTNTSGVWGVLHGQSALSQIQTPWFTLITLFTVLMMLRINYFVASLRTQYTYLLGSSSEARTINSVFDIMLPVGGLFSIPFIGTFLDKLKTRTVLAVLVSTATVMGVLGCIPHSTEAAYANITLFVLYRPFYYTAVSDYAAKVFGFQTFGKVYGLIICLAGVGNFAQAGLDALTLKVFDGNPVPVNAALTTVVAIVGASLAGFVSLKTSILLSSASKVETREDHPGLVRIDWEREPLLTRSGSIEGGGQRAYGT
ncbi:unnamed protein product [Penicillium manginii]